METVETDLRAGYREVMTLLGGEPVHIGGPPGRRLRPDSIPGRDDERDSDV
jgi:hypothetical protein